MLIMKPNCECCDKDLHPSSKDALICSAECTFCVDCMQKHFDNICPNCGGEVTRRPTRVKPLLDTRPASTKRVLRDGAPCIHYR